MAFANIGLVIVAGIYAFLPELTGKRLYSESLAKLHVWAMFVGASGMPALAGRSTEEEIQSVSAYVAGAGG